LEEQTEGTIMPNLTFAPSPPTEWPGFQWMWPFTGAFGANAPATKSGTLAMPLSGNVDQVIDPWTLMLQMVGNQFGLININLGKSSDPDLEKEIIQDVGTYGKQLGQIGDALQVLLNHVKLDKLTNDEKRAIQALQFQLAEIDRLKAKRK
jgi:hypothetical protein